MTFLCGAVVDPSAPANVCILASRHPCLSLTDSSRARARRYCFDRSFHKSAADRQKSHVKMHTEFKGRHASLHGVHDWLSVLGKNDK
jgi:hypothetical protein